jgi:hypothetical protein
MFDRVSQAAEKLATNVSRRAFLGRLGQAALAVAGVMGATLAFPGLAQANKGGTTHKVCTCTTLTAPIRVLSSSCIRCDKVCFCGLYSGTHVSACTCNHDCSSCT